MGAMTILFFKDNVPILPGEKSCGKGFIRRTSSIDLTAAEWIEEVHQRAQGTERSTISKKESRALSFF
jgi:hypothetical protein